MALATGPADFSFFFGVPTDTPFTADFNGDGTTTVGVYRETTGFVYYRNDLMTGFAEAEFFFGIPGDVVVAGDWDDDNDETVGILRPSLERFFLTNTNATGPADIEFDFGEGDWLPVAGEFAAMEITMPASDNQSFEATFDSGAGDFIANVMLTATVDVPNGDPFTVSWESDIEGPLGTGMSITAALSTNLADTLAHQIAATMTTASGTVTDTVNVIVFVGSN